ncbi:MAG TPA: hypothetical protein VI875_03005 [Candidatus Norongarragalinales archaeon]|nr:hypothetical protein [Candidatus Norongarragalinales archaeon]
MAVSLREFTAPARAKQSAPEFNAAAAPNLYVPMQSNQQFGDGTPVNSLMVKTRGEIIKDWFGEKWKEGSLGTVYKAWLYCVVSLIAVVFFYGINLWIAAFFAYLTGYFWSQLLLNYAWSVEWFKGKACISTK